LKKLLEKEDAGVVEVYLDDLEVKVVQNAFKVVIKEIEEWEFQIRVGVYLETVKDIPIFKEIVE